MEDFGVLYTLAIVMFSFSLFAFSLWVKKRDLKKNLPLALQLFVMALYCLVWVQISKIVEPPNSVFWFRVCLAADCLIAPLFLWYVADLTGLVPRRRLLVWSLVFGAFAIIGLVLPGDSIVDGSRPLEFEVPLPLGVRLAYHVVTIGPLAVVPMLVSLPLALQIGGVLLRHGRSGRRREATRAILHMSLAFGAVSNDFLVGMGVYQFLFVIPYAWALSTLLLAYGAWLEIVQGAEAMDDLAATEARLGAVVQMAPISVWMCDTSGVIVLQNDTHISLVGRHVGEKFSGWLVSGKSQLEDADRRALAGEIVEEHVSYDIGSLRKTYRIIMAPTRSGSQIIGTVGLGLDITSEVRLQNQLMQSQKMESLGSLAGGIAHEMNNVLGAILIKASTQLLKHPEESATHHAFQTIAKASSRGGRLVKRLLEFARQRPSEEFDVDVNELLAEAVVLLQPEEPTVHLEMDLDPELRPVRGDRTALTSAFTNLCVNALEAMAGVGTLTLRTRNLDIDTIQVTIRDTGGGMQKEVLEKALDPFFTTKPAGGGSGLGLSLVYTTVKAHQGRMEIHSEPGQGTTVSVYLSTGLLGPKAQEPQPAPRPQPLGESLKVLLVDDDELILDSMTEALENLGHAVLAAARGEEALVHLENGLEFDAVVLDMNMPGLGGFGTLPLLRALRPDLPVLIATGRPDHAVLELMVAYPHVSMLPKPFTIEELQEELRHIQKE